MTAQVRAGLVGMGTMGSLHARILRTLEKVELVGVHDPFSNQSQSGITFFPLLEDLLAQSLDFVVISSPTAFHRDAAIQAIEAKVAIFIEKPLAATVFESLEILEAAKTYGQLGAVGHIERFNPAIGMMKSLLEQEFLGELYQVSTTRTGPFPHRISDVGVAKDLGSHDIDLTRWLTGAEYVDVHATSAATRGRSHEDFFLANGSLSNGIIFNHEINWMSPVKERITKVIGEKGMLVANTLSSELFFHETGVVRSDWAQSALLRGPVEGNSTRFAIPRTEPILAEHLDFQRLLAGDPSTRIASLKDGHEVLLALTRALG